MLQELFGTADIASSKEIDIELPALARDGEMVPIRIRSGFENTESIAIVVESNPAPFTAFFRIYEPQTFVSTRIRVVNNGELLVIVKADGVLHTRLHPVRVGAGMCGA